MLRLNKCSQISHWVVKPPPFFINIELFQDIFNSISFYVQFLRHFFHITKGRRSAYVEWHSKACPVKLILLPFYFWAEFLDVFYRKVPSHAVVYFWRAWVLMKCYKHNPPPSPARLWSCGATSIRFNYKLSWLTNHGSLWEAIAQNCLSTKKNLWKIKIHQWLDYLTEKIWRKQSKGRSPEPNPRSHPE